MQEIRNKTEELLNDYRMLTGTDYTPSLPEFLELRRQAIEECRLGLAGTEKALPRAVRISSTPPEPERVRQIRPAEKQTEKDEKREERTDERNGFAILTELADPWN